MRECYLEVLKKIEESGFVAYVVGGFVRDRLLGLDSVDIDIITNATPKDLNKIFDSTKKIYEEYGAVKLQINNHIIDITTFRKELSYENGKPNQIEYTSSLETDLYRRDFTINTLCMDRFLNVIDLLNGKSDIDNKIIKTIKQVDIELKEDPSRIIRALRFMSELDFVLSDEIDCYIKNNKEEILKISYFKRKDELDKLFKTKKVFRFFNYVKENGLEEFLGIKFDKIVLTDTIIGFWSQMDVDSNYPFTKNEKKEIKDIKYLLNKGKIDRYDLYNKGMYISSIAADILDIDKKELNLIYTNFPIKSIMDIDISSNEICEFLNIEPGEKLGNVFKTLEYEIVSGLLKNEKEEIKKSLSEI